MGDGVVPWKQYFSRDESQSYPLGSVLLYERKAASEMRACRNLGGWGRRDGDMSKS